LYSASIHASLDAALLINTSVGHSYRFASLLALCSTALEWPDSIHYAYITMRTLSDTFAASTCCISSPLPSSSSPSATLYCTSLRWHLLHTSSCTDVERMHEEISLHLPTYIRFSRAVTMRPLYTVAAILALVTCPAAATPTSLTGVVEGLTQGKSGEYDVGAKCHNDGECKNSLACFGKTTVHRGRCVYRVASRNDDCKIEGDAISSHNRCSFGLACVTGKCQRAKSEGYQFGTPGIGEPCLNPLRPNKERPFQFVLQPREGIPCQSGFECKTSEDEPDGVGACFPK
jgi:hypothetical protein